MQRKAEAMALRSSPRDTTADRLEPIDRNPEFARLAEVRRVLATAKRVREAGVDVLMLENELSRPTGSGRGERGRMLRERLEGLRVVAASLPEKPTATSTPDGLSLSPAVERGLAVAQGEAIGAEPDRNARLMRLRSEVEILDAASRVIEDAIDRKRVELSAAVAARLLPTHRQIMKVMFENAVALAASVQAERKVIADVIVAGYEVCPDVLRRPLLRSGICMGTLQEYDSEISVQKRALEAQGII